MQPSWHQNRIKNRPNEFGNKAGQGTSSGIRQTSSGIRQTSSGIRPNEFGNKTEYGEHGSNMAPTWLLKRSQNQEKIEAKNDQNFDASWGRFLEDFGRFGEAKWNQVGTKMTSKMELILKTLKIRKTMENQ